MTDKTADIEALARAMELFTQTTQSMEEAYRRLEARVNDLDKELADKNRQLALTSDYLGNLLECMSDGVIAVDTDGVITRFNRAANAILGYAAEEVLGKPFEEVFGRDFTAPHHPGAMELRARSGRLAPVNERDAAVADANGRRLGAVKTFQDLTELIALRDQVRQIDRLAAVGEMAATVAHEIRNPLGGIRGFAAFLAQDIPSDDPRRRLVDKIEEGARSLDKVVNELLEYTRPVEVRLERTGCRAVVDAAIGYLPPTGGRVRIENRADSALAIRADADKIRQVFLNVLLNAVQSIAETGRIEVETQADDSYAEVIVRDTGCGMDAAQVKQIFSPFYTTKEKGTGLGLAVSMKIVESHGGDMRVESAPGAGSAVVIRLPRAE